MIFPTLFLSYFSDVLTMIMTSVSAIFLFISESLSVFVKYSCVVYMLEYIVEGASVVLSSTNPSFLPSFLPSLVSAVERSIRIQSLFYYLFKIISSLIYRFSQG